MVDDSLTVQTFMDVLKQDIKVSSDGSAPGDVEILTPILLSLTTSSTTLTEVIKHLGPSLTSEDGLVRRRATALLVHLLSHLIPSSSSDPAAPTATPSYFDTRAHALRLLQAFFLARFSDYPSLLPSIKGMTHLLRAIEAGQQQQQQGETPRDPAAVPIAQALFRELAVQAAEQATRSAVYTLLTQLATSPVFSAELLAAPPTDTSTGAPGGVSYALDFVGGFIAAMDGEKDPRCLLQCLALSRHLLSQSTGWGDVVVASSPVSSVDADAAAAGAAREEGEEDEEGRGGRGGDNTAAAASPTTTLVGDLFSVTACYFPITFTPPPNDPYGITAEGLASALLGVFTASPALAPHVLPTLLEKLSSSLAESKRAACQALAACAPVYGRAGLAPHTLDIAAALRGEIINPRGGSAASTPAPLPHPSPSYSAFSGSTCPAFEREQLLGNALSSSSAVTTTTPSSSSSSSKEKRPIWEEALGALVSITRVLSEAVSRGESGGDSSSSSPSSSSPAPTPQFWQDWLGLCVHSSVSEFERAPDSAGGRAGARLLCALGGASPHALAAVAQALVPPCTREILADASAHPTHKAHTITIPRVVGLLCGLVQSSDPGIDHPPGGHPLHPFVGALEGAFWGVLSQALGGGGGSSGGSSTSSTSTSSSVGVAPVPVEALCGAVMGLCDLCVRTPTPLLSTPSVTSLVARLTVIVLGGSEGGGGGGGGAPPAAPLRRAAAVALGRIGSKCPAFSKVVVEGAVGEFLRVLQEGGGEVVVGRGEKEGGAVLGFDQDELHRGLSSKAYWALRGLGHLAIGGGGGGATGSGGLAVWEAVIPALVNVITPTATSNNDTNNHHHFLPLEPVLRCIAHVALLKALPNDKASVAAMDSLAGSSSTSSPSVLEALLNLALSTGSGGGGGGGGGGGLSSHASASLGALLRLVCCRASPRVGEGLVKGVACLLLGRSDGGGGNGSVEGVEGGEWALPPSVRAASLPYYPPFSTATSASSSISSSSIGSLPWPNLLVFLAPLACSRVNTQPTQQQQQQGIITDVVEGLVKCTLSGVWGVSSSSSGGTDVGAPSSGEGSEGESGQALLTAASQCIGTLVNKGCKVGGGGVISWEGILAAIKQQHIASASASSSGSGGGSRVASGMRAITLALWVFKGLAHKGLPAASHFLDFVLGALAGGNGGGGGGGGDGGSPLPPPPPPEVALGAAVCLEEVVSTPLPFHPFSTECGCTPPGTTLQRLFSALLQRLAAAAGAAAGAAGAPVAAAAPPPLTPPVPILLALCSILSHLPSTLLLSQVGKVMSVVVQTLELTTTTTTTTAAATTNSTSASPLAGITPHLLDSVRVSALRALGTLLDNSPATVTPHILTLAPRLVSMTQQQQQQQGGGGGLPPPRPLVRALALDCLRSVVARLPHHAIHPIKGVVIQGLVPALDDDKRAVRRRAGACRNAWML